jgi:hypothetical protein
MIPHTTRALFIVLGNVLKKPVTHWPRANATSYDTRPFIYRFWRSYNPICQLRLLIYPVAIKLHVGCRRLLASMYCRLDRQGRRLMIFSVCSPCDHPTCPVLNTVTMKTGETLR